MGSDIEMHDPPSIVSQNQENVQDLKPNRRHGEEVDRHHGFDVILKEGPPGLRRWLVMPRHVFAYAGLADVDAELEQFAVYTRCAPQHILAAQPADQFSNIFRDRRPARLTVTNFLRPEQPEALAVPGNDGFRFDDHQGRSPIAPRFARPYSTDRGFVAKLSVLRKRADE